MATGYEVKMYHDITRIADALEKIAASLESLGKVTALGGLEVRRETAGPERAEWARDLVAADIPTAVGYLLNDDTIRSWAKRSGYQVNDTGPMPMHVVTDYLREHA